MELRRKNIIPGDGRGKGMWIAGAAGREVGIRGLAVVAVDEVEAAAVGNAPPEGVLARLPNLVPAHVRNLETGGARLRRIGEGDHVSSQKSEPRRLSLRAFLEEHLLADAQAEERFSARRLLDGFAEPAFPEAAHAIGHRALPRENHAVGAPYGRGVAGNFNLRLRRHMGERLLDGAKVAHSVIDDGDALRHEAAVGKSPRATLWSRESCRRLADRARPPCAAPVQTP